MTDDPLENPMRELTWRRKLTDADQARLRSWLAQHPEAQTDLESEAALNEALDTLPDAPLASNFTARLLRRIESQESSPVQSPPPAGGFLRLLLRWLPTTAVGALTLGIALISY